MALEGSSAAILGAPLVGFLAESAFGYQRTSLLVKDMPVALRLGNANALARSLFLLTVIPWSISFVLYSLLHFTYGKREDAQTNRVGERASEGSREGWGEQTRAGRRTAEEGGKEREDEGRGEEAQGVKRRGSLWVGGVACVLLEVDCRHFLFLLGTHR